MLKKRKMDEIEKNKNGKCLRICPLTSPDEDELIKRLSKILKHPSVGARPAATDGVVWFRSASEKASEVLWAPERNERRVIKP